MRGATGDMLEIEFLRQQAARCRRLAGAVNDPWTRHELLQMALEYDAEAAALAVAASDVAGSGTTTL
jgi:hypothetical protein